MAPDAEVFLWDQFRGLLVKRFGHATFKNWFETLRFDSAENNDLILNTPSKVVRNWIHTHYLSHLEEVARQINPEIRSIQIEQSAAETTTKPQSGSDDTVETAADLFRERGLISKNLDNRTGITAPARSAMTETDDFMESFASLDPRFTFDNFVVDKTNELAFAAARRIADSDEVQFNPGQNASYARHRLADSSSESRS